MPTARTSFDDIGQRIGVTVKTKVLVSAMLALFIHTTHTAEAEVRIVATTSSMTMLAREIGGDNVDITTLVPPDRDAHYLLAKPSMMIALRRADLLISVGADLEIGWLPAAIRGANNFKIVPGQSGYFEGAAQIDLIEVGQAADRSQGDVHPRGNPHYYMDPRRMATVAEALATRLADLDPDNRDVYAGRADRFATAVAARVPQWQSAATGSPGVIFYHKDGNYLAALLGIQIHGFVEPLPGIPPTASHLRDLIRRLGDADGVILYNTFHPHDGPEFLSRNLGWKRIQLQLEVPLDATGSTYLAHIDTWVQAITSGGE